MGQYYKPVNLDRQEFVSSYDYGSGAKLMEHSWLLGRMVNAIVIALSPRGAWYGKRLVWAGDYMDKGLFLDDISGRQECHSTLYECCGENENDKPCMIKVRPIIPDGPAPVVIVNHDTKEFVRLADLPEEEPSDPGWHLHPLPLLTCSGNGRGGEISWVKMSIPEGGQDTASPLNSPRLQAISKYAPTSPSTVPKTRYWAWFRPNTFLLSDHSSKLGTD